jgi:hypothetical protein
VDTKQFLGSVLGSEGNYCLWCYNSNNKTDIKQEFYPSIDELIQRADELDAAAYNVFFALGTFKEPDNRKQINVNQMKSFFIDLDCGPSKEFIDQPTAFEELRRFCKANKLPRPTIVNSGNGLHVYWPLTEAVDEKTWFPVAEGLKQLCIKQDFPADPSRTSDAASILRVPNTYNYKGDDPKPVGLLHGYLAEPIDFSEFEDCVGGAIPVPEKFAPSAYREALNAQTSGSFKRLLEKTDNDQGCAQIQYIIDNQDSVSYDMWRAGLSIAKVCVDGDKAARVMSSKHPEYDFNETMRKMMDTGGPQYCSTFAKHNPDGCDGCPNALSITTPAQLTKIVEEAPPEPEIPQYPAPYMRGKNGGVYMRTKDEEGNPIEVPIYHHDFYVTRRLHDVEQGEVVAFALHLPRDGVREFTVPLMAITSREEFRKNMAMKGITTYGEDLGKLMKYVQTWVNELQQTGAASEAHQQFGWVNDDTMQEFVLGDKLIKADTVEYNPPSSKTAGFVDAFKPMGSADRQREILSFFNVEGLELHQFVVCMGLGSILMPLTGLFSFAAHLYGGSGVGKTTALYCNTAIWGDPHFLTLGQRDTPNSRMARGEVYKNISLNSDEMSNMTPFVASDYCYQFAEGKQRNRLQGSANTERWRGKPWRMMGCSSGNISIYELLSKLKADPEAEMQRILEFTVDPNLKAIIDKDKTDALYRDIQTNYGHFSVPYIQYVIQNRDQIAKLYAGIKERLDKAANLTAVNRFFSAGCTNVLVAATIGNKLGIVGYDVRHLFDWIVVELKRVKAVISDTGPDTNSIIADFARDNWGSILKIKSTDDNRDDVVDLVIPENMPKNKLIGRYETDTKLMFIPTKEFKKYLVDQYINYASTVKSLKEEMGATMKSVYMTKGTSLNLPSQYCIVVKMEGLDETT